MAEEEAHRDFWQEKKDKVGRDIGSEGGPGGDLQGRGISKEIRRERVAGSPGNRSVQGERARSRTRPSRTGKMAGRRTADKGGDYKDADGNTFREVKSIRGGGRRTTKWVKVTREGEARPKLDNED